MKSKVTFILIGILAILAIVLAGCSANLATNPTNSQTPSTQASNSQTTSTQGTSISNTPVSGAPGTLEVRVTDAPPQQNVTSVMVTVSSVEVHQVSGNATATATITPASTTSPTATAASEQNEGKGKGQGQNQDEKPSAVSNNETETESNDDNGGWIPLAVSGSSTFDLLKVKGLEQFLAVGELQAGKYGQIRMEVTKVQVAINGGELQDATIPSGKLKFIQSFDIAAGKTTVILFDFDAAKSVNITGNGKILFKPVIKLGVTKNPGNMQITTENIPNGKVGVSSDITLEAMGGKKPYTWSLASGSFLPTNLSLSSSGVISGIPTTAGEYTFTVKVEDSSAVKKTDTKNFNLKIDP